MHRSGTSAIAKGIESWGITLGDDLLGAAPDNPRGYWEDREVVAINQSLLQHLDIRWNEARLVSRKEILAADDRTLFMRATALLRNRCESWGAWGFKDPRTLRTLPFWLEAADSAGVELRFLWALRHPAEVGASLADRNAIDPVRSQLMWVAHWVPFLLLLRGRRNAVIRFSELFQDPETIFHKTASSLGYQLHKDLLPQYKGQFLHAELRHHNRADDSALMPFVAQLYHVLDTIETTPDEAFWMQWQLLYEAIIGWNPVFTLLDYESDWRRRRRSRLWKITHGK